MVTTRSIWLSRLPHVCYTDERTESFQKVKLSQGYIQYTAATLKTRVNLFHQILFTSAMLPALFISGRTCATRLHRRWGRPLEVGLQEQASNHLKLHLLRAGVVSVKEKALVKVSGMNQ
jgi:hypothetical protein